MSGKEDLRALSAYIASLIPSKDYNDEDIEGIAAVAMNRATNFGSLGEAIESMDPPAEFVELMQGTSTNMMSFKKSIQIASRFLNGNEDKSNGAFFFFPKGKSPAKELGLEKTYGTKNFNFFKYGAKEESAPKRVRGRKVRKLQEAPVQEVSLPQGGDTGEM